MDRNLRLLGVGVGIRMFGNALFFPFLALFLYNILHLGYVSIGIVIAGVGAIQVPFNVLGGLLTDRFGRRRLILVGLAAEALTAAGLAYGFALASLPIAIATATVGGCVGTVSAPASSAYIADFASGAERTRGFTFLRIGFNAGYSGGVSVGGLLISLIGFPGAVAVGAAIIGAGTGFLALTLAPSPWDLDGGAAPGTAAPAAGTRPRGMVESLRVLARDRVALELLIAVALASLVVSQWSVIFPLFVHNVLGVSYLFLGAGLALNGLIVVFGQSATTERVIGWRHTTIAILGLAFYAAAFLGLGAAGWFDLLPVVAFFVSVLVLTIGENLITIPQATLPSNLAPPEEVGAYNGAFNMMGGIGGIVSLVVGGAVLAATANPLLIWVLLLVPIVPSVVLFRHAAGRLAPEVDRA